MGFWSKAAPWRSNEQYQSIDTLYSQKENIKWYWRFIAQVAVYMILGGYLILPTTFDDDPRLRFNKGVLAIIIVALLTGGYSLTGLVWFACPSTLFRIDHIFIPVFSVSVFAFCATCYALAASPRYVFSHAAAPTTLALTLASALLYGVFAMMNNRNIQRMRSSVDANQFPRNSTTVAPAWQEAGYYQNYNQNMRPSASRSPASAYEPYAARSPGSFDGGSMITVTQQPSEEELVKQQMAKLLTRPDLGIHQNSSRSTFHLDWPQGEEPDVELEGSAGGGRRKHRTTVDGSQLLVPSAAGRKRSKSAGSAAQHTYSPASNGRRDDRRREIELNNLPTTSR